MTAAIQAEYIVVGSGPGGASVARELALAGKDVLILERGGEHRGRFYYGTYPGALIYCQNMSLLFTREGLNIIVPQMVGGATSMYTACAAEPPLWFKEHYGLDVEAEAAEISAELDIKPLPPEMRGPASTRLAQAAGELGMEWYAQPKFMYPQRRSNLDKPFDCRAACMLGCRCGAKWGAAEWVDEAVANGARLLTGAKVERVLTDGGMVQGVQVKRRGGGFVAESQNVILSAGGIGSPRILQASGFDAAGKGLTMDTTVMVYGFSKEPGTGKEPPMTWSYNDDDAGFMLSTLTDPWLMYPLQAMRKGIGPTFNWLRWNKVMGLMIKLKDDISGGIEPGGRISKPLTPGDKQRLDAAEAVCHDILEKAGCPRSSMFMTPQRGTHPSGTVRVGHMLGTDLATDTAGLYVCDASVFPESLDRPTVLTILALGRRLGRMLAGQ